ncbi:MAG: hypothetical protein WCI75_18615, partial [candidate division NC10 bacterium]
MTAAARRAKSAPTLARLLIDIWKIHVPVCIRGARQDCANRRVGMRASQLMYVTRYFPEFKAAEYGQREFRRIAEAWPCLTMMPDGTMPDEFTLNYYSVWPLAL